MARAPLRITTSAFLVVTGLGVVLDSVVQGFSVVFSFVVVRAVLLEVVVEAG